MILLVHMLFGAAVGSLVQNPLAGTFLALASHYFLDIFPHIEYLESTEESIKTKKPGDIVKILTDFALGILLMILFSGNQAILYVYAFVAIVPDGLTVVTHLLPNLLLQKHHHLHGGIIHYLTKQKKFPTFWKIATQVVAVSISLVLLVR